MTKEFTAVPTDIYQLAREAQALVKETASGAAEAVRDPHMSLAAGLDRVRGAAIQQARAVNARLRKQACLATAIGLGLGAVLGYFGSSRKQTGLRR